MDHRCDMTYSELLESMGAREGAYLLLCGEVGAPSPHRALVEPITGGAAAPKSEASEVSSWAEYYAARELSPDTPLPLLLTFPLTLYHLLMDHPARAAKATTGDEPLRVHVLGPEKEAFLLPLFGELNALLPRSRLEISMIGPVAFDLPTWPSVFEGAGGGKVSVSLHRGAYHTLAREGQLPPGGPPDLVVALNAGLAAQGYGWAPTLELLAKRGSPFYFTDYSEYSADKAVAFAEKAGLVTTTPVVLNPFRAPLRQPLVAGGSVGFPWLSNGFYAGFNTGG